MKMTVGSRLGRVLLTLFIAITSTSAFGADDELEEKKVCGTALQTVRLTRLARLRLRWSLAMQEFKDVERQAGRGHAYAYMVGAGIGLLTSPFAKYLDDSPPPYALAEPVAIAYFENLSRVIDVIAADARDSGINSPVSRVPVKMDMSRTLEPNGAVALDLPERGPITLLTPLGRLVVFEEIGSRERAVLLFRLTESFGLIESVALTTDGHVMPKIFTATRMPNGMALPEPSFVGWDRPGLSYNEHMRLWNLVKPADRAAIDPPPPRQELVLGWKDLEK